jgi:hypothetical protein
MRILFLLKNCGNEKKYENKQTMKLISVKKQSLAYQQTEKIIRCVTFEEISVNISEIIKNKKKK